MGELRRIVKRVLVREAADSADYHYAVHPTGRVHAGRPEWSHDREFGAVCLTLIGESTPERHKSAKAMVQALISKYKLPASAVEGFPL